MNDGLLPFHAPVLAAEIAPSMARIYLYQRRHRAILPLARRQAAIRRRLADADIAGVMPICFGARCDGLCIS